MKTQVLFLAVVLLGANTQCTADSADNLRLWLVQANTVQDAIGASLEDLVPYWSQLSKLTTEAIDGAGEQCTYGLLLTIAFSLGLEAEIPRYQIAALKGESPRRSLCEVRESVLPMSERYMEGPRDAFGIHVGSMRRSPFGDIPDYKDEYAPYIAQVCSAWFDTFIGTGSKPSAEWSRQALPIALSVRREMLANIGDKIDPKTLNESWSYYMQSSRLAACIVFLYDVPDYRAPAGDYRWTPEGEW
ncbi:MAG: hypothetical protein WCP21_02585 [Armatimonadota bacterium]